MSTRAQTQAQLKQAFSAVLPSACIDSLDETQRVFECDGLPMYRQLPLITLLPQTVAQVQSIMRICHQLGQAVVVRGGGTGLSAGATPNAEGVLLCMSKFTQIIDIDPDSRLAVVQPGVRNIAISEAAAAHGLYYAPDPSSQIACTIGGNIAENAGGVHCLKYGVTVNNVLALELVDAKGDLLHIGNAGLDSNGPDLMALLTGSEGLLGIVVSATLKLLPVPEKMQVVMAAFDDVARAGEAVGAVIAEGIVPAGLEMMDQLAIDAVEQYLHAGYPTEAQALLLCEVDGSVAEVEEHIATVSDIFKAKGAQSIRVSQSEQERLLLWKGRKDAFPAVGRLSPDYYCMDGTIPRSEIASVLQQISAYAQTHGLRVANVFHAGDGNLHPLILFDANQSGELERAEALGARILEACVAAGGCITGEHGVGLEKLGQMHDQFDDAELQQFQAIKTAFDAEQRLNPGKGIPILKNCQEYRSLNAKPTPDEARQ